MSLVKVTTEVTYKVPAWEYCNMQATLTGRPSKEACRFCVKEKGHSRCALYNEVLNTENGTLIRKTRSCEKACAGFNVTVVDVEAQPVVDPKTLMKATIKEYEKLRKKLLGQGYPAALAEQLATEFVMGG